MQHISHLSASKIWATLLTVGFSHVSLAQLPYPIIDTHQNLCSDSTAIHSNCTASQGRGQDAQYQGLSPSYTDNGDATVSDNHTRLMWSKTPDLNQDGVITAKDKVTYDQAVAYVAQLNLAGHSDWRLPTIKELYSLILFDGQDPSGLSGAGTYSIRPFIDHGVFGFASGDTKAGERLIDSQYISSTKYVSTTMKGDETVFGVNFIDGRIKGYGLSTPSGKVKTFYLLAVRGNSNYGINQFVDNGNGSITDNATGLTWQKDDSQQAMDWFASLNYCESLELAGNNSWRLPNVKELQSIVDYSRSPDTTNSAAIAPIFNTSTITNEAEKLDYPNYWSSTTHLNLRNGNNAAYLAFGRSLGYMKGQWLDVHGAGAQRSDPKQYRGKDYPQGHGPQGDAIRYNNFARCVTDTHSTFITSPTATQRATKQYILDGTKPTTNNKTKRNDKKRKE